MLFVGKIFEVCYDGFIVFNVYDEDGCYMCYVIIEGLYVGVKGEVEYMW